MRVLLFLDEPYSWPKNQRDYFTGKSSSVARKIGDPKALVGCKKNRGHVLLRKEIGLSFFKLISRYWISLMFFSRGMNSDEVLLGNCSSLSKARLGQLVQIQSLSGEKEKCRRLREVGFTETTMVSKLRDGENLVCMVSGSRMAISRDLADCIFIEEVSESLASFTM